MNCSTCIKVNPLPECAAYDGSVILTGLTFVQQSETLQGQLVDIATGKVQHFQFDTDAEGIAEINLSDFYPLMNHVFELRFLFEGAPATFVLTNSDDTTDTGCCIEFGITDGLTADGEIALTTLTCVTE